MGDSMIKKYEDILKGIRNIQMANIDNQDLLKLGLEPLYLKVRPVYINLSGDIFYSTTDHYNCQLSEDVKKILSIMNSNEYERIRCDSIYNNDIYNCQFIIYKEQIFFDSLLSFQAYKKFSYIREYFQTAYGVTKQFYEPSKIEIYQRYYEPLMLKENGWPEVKYVNYNLLPKEYLDLFYLMSIEDFSLHKNPHSISGRDVRDSLNYNANIFWNFKNSLSIIDAYNLDTMNLLNSIKSTKSNVYSSLYELACKSKNMKKTVKELLIELNVYQEYEKWLEKKPRFNSKEDWKTEMYFWTTFDLLVQFIGFDKIEIQRSRTITTTKSNIYEEFFNLLIMEWDIVQLPKLIFDEDKQKFIWLPVNDLVTTGEDRECEEEIKLIKKYVPYDERYKYLK